MIVNNCGIENKFWYLTFIGCICFVNCILVYTIEKDCKWLAKCCLLLLFNTTQQASAPI